MIDLHDQRVLVIGGSAGIGLATARLAAQYGASVVITSRTQDRLDAALSQLPDPAEGHLLDVTNEESVERLFAAVGELDHLVYTAGEPLRPFPIDGLDLDDARVFLETRLWGAVAAVKHAHARIRPGGSIALTSGSAGARPQPGWLVGAGICGAIESITRTLAVELAPIRVNAFAPGIVRTELWHGIPEADREAMFEATAQQLPVGRIGTPKDVALTVVYLMADGYVTGTVAELNGGGNLV